jgi:hypothetical protein
MRPHPLQNRVDPFGALHAVAARGALMGNRGGRFHGDDKTLGNRRWAGRRWIACLCAFKGHRRTVWGAGYTELFFLDEVTALAGGHRPCFECRREDALAFRAAFAGGGAPGADEMDAVLHNERLASGGRARTARLGALPDGAMAVIDGAPYAMRAGCLLPWSFAGYGAALLLRAEISVNVLTPPSILAALRAGYSPLWHPTAQTAVTTP